MITGDPVILVDAEGLSAYGLKEGDRGIANSMIKIPVSGDDLVYFMKNGTRESIVIQAHRCIVDEERKANAIDIEDVLEGM